MKNRFLTGYQPLLDLSIFGQLPRLSVMVMAGLVLGLLPKASEYVEPFLYFFIPGWFIFVFSRVFGFLRNPRKEAFAFIIGLPYSMRRDAALRFINAMQKRLFVLLGTSICSYGASHLHGGVFTMVHKTFGFEAILFGQAILLYLFLLSAVLLRVLHPSRNDPRQLILFNLRGSSAKQAAARIILRIARTASQHFPGPAGIIIKRQVLYLLRHDLLTLAASWAIAFFATGTVAFLVWRQSAAAICISFFALLCLLLFITTACLGDSAEKLYECPYYFFKKSTAFGANLILAAGLCAPFLILGLILPAAHAHESYLRMALDAGTFLLVVASFCLSIAQLWSFGPHSPTIAGTIALSIVCGLLGIMIPWYGVLFPLAALGVFVFLEMPRLRND
jgi:hypothetical protein